jgi:uncharacterized membrane protein
MREGNLSLTAELLWLSVAPAHGGLLPSRGRGRLRKALAAARQVERPVRFTVAPGWSAGRSARRELIAAGLVERSLLLRNLRLTDKRAAGRRFRSLWESIAAKELSVERDTQLALLLASAGVLPARLTPYEREIAWRRLKGALSSEDAGTWIAPLSAAAPLSDGIAALGTVALHGIESLVSDFGSHDGGGGGGPSFGQ